MLKLLIFFITMSSAIAWSSVAEDQEHVFQRNAEFRATTFKNLRKLKAKKIIGLEFIEAGAGMTAAQSRWGHALLRFVDSDQDDFNDIVVGFIADVDDVSIDTLKGLNGGYKATLEITSMTNYIQLYNRDQARTLTRHIIVSDAVKIARLVTLLEEFLNNPKFAGRYYFIQRNCAVILQSMLMKAGHPTHSTAIKPVSVDSALQKAATAPYPPIAMLNTQTLAQRFLGLLVLSPKQSLTEVSRDSFLRYKHTVDNLTLLRSYYLLKRNLNEAVVTEMYSELLRRNVKVNLNEVFLLKAAPKELYFLCSTAACHEQVIAAARGFWNRPSLLQHCSLIAPLWDSVLYSPDSNPVNTLYFRNGLVIKNSLCSGLR